MVSKQLEKSLKVSTLRSVGSTSFVICPICIRYSNLENQSMLLLPCHLVVVGQQDVWRVAIFRVFSGDSSMDKALYTLTLVYPEIDPILILGKMNIWSFKTCSNISNYNQLYMFEIIWEAWAKPDWMISLAALKSLDSTTWGAGDATI